MAACFLNAELIEFQAYTFRGGVRREQDQNGCVQAEDKKACERCPNWCTATK